jgi:hypothetical protein
MGWPEPHPVIVYWGDMDRDGFEILSGIRHALGSGVLSLLMDDCAYRRYCDRGVGVDPEGRALSAEPRDRALPLLEPGEAVGDRLVCFEGAVRRIEQEAIPPPDVADALATVLARSLVGGDRRTAR